MTSAQRPWRDKIATYNKSSFPRKRFRKTIQWVEVYSVQNYDNFHIVEGKQQMMLPVLFFFKHNF